MASIYFLSYQFTFSALVLVLSVLVAQHLIRKLSKKQVKHKYHPVGGTVFNQLLNFNKLHHYMTNLAGKYKTYRLLAPFRSEVYTADPVNVEYILKTNFENYGKGGHNYDNLSGLLGDGIFTVDGDKWRQQRKVSSYEFSTKVLRDFSSVIFRKNVAKLANIVSEAAKANQSMDIQDLFMKSTLDSIFKVAFGVELDSMCGSNEEGVKFTRAFDDASALTLWRYVDVFWKIKRFLNIGSEAALKKNVKVVNDFVYKLINKKIELMRNSEEVSSLKKDDILSRFLKVNDNDPTYLRDIILNFVIAGKDTTAAALSWFIYMLCKHPAIQNKIVQEVREATGVKEITDFAEFAAGINEEALEKMNYLHAAISETLRLYPSVPVDTKICFSDDTLPDGFNVRKGDMVAYQPYAMGRMKFVWGDDAEEYKPERWLNKDGVFQPESPFKFTAFQAGPRICLGKEFAYRQMKIFAAVLLGSFIFKLADEKKPVNYRTMINLHVDGGLHVDLDTNLYGTVIPAFIDLRKMNPCTILSKLEKKPKRAKIERYPPPKAKISRSQFQKIKHYSQAVENS
ncbi:CYTOCHROME P450 [Salix koriyanagi]|uniref:CYTOCHROME P450 n=1 Tax=Salix koriyanagi TaxID=2511006 RepID=A0A9Q0U3M0_9ROSI|nr:CYTOCHROME P450 [Salix koriyanagi]